MKFDVSGKRTEIIVQISSLTTEGSIQIATWDVDFGIKATPIAGATSTGTENMRNRTFIVLISIVRKMPNLWNCKRELANFEWKFLNIFRRRPMECSEKQVSFAIHILQFDAV